MSKNHSISSDNSDDSGGSRFSRRTILRSGVTTLAVGGASAGLLVHSSSPALAAEMGTWTATDLTITTEDGTITDVFVAEADTTFDVQWSNFDDQKTITMDIEANLPNDTSQDGSATFEQIATGDFDTDGSSSGSTTLAELTWNTSPFQFSFLDHSSITAQKFENLEDGTTASETIGVRVTFHTTDQGGNTIETVHEFQFAVTTDNLAGTMDSGGTMEPQGTA